MLARIALALLLTLTMPAAAETITGRASVVDGDTLEIRSTKVRLNGIDAPESGQMCLDAAGQSYRCGQKAALALAEKVGTSNLKCEVLDSDRYGRSVSRCSLGDQDLNRWMVLQGWALAYRSYSTDYVDEEDTAREARRGLWQGTFDPPWDLRKQNRSPAVTGSAPAPRGCEIKGNIGGKGDRIYHTPGQRDYQRTTINTTKGERWFCSNQEAEAAGWRHAQR